MADSVDVLVIGAGPTGLMAACELVRRGLSVRIVDERPAASTKSKAIVVHARTLELLEEAGVSEALIARGLPLRGVTMWAGGEVIVTAEFEDLDSRFPYLLSISQADTERVLTDRLEQLGGKIERETQLLRLRQDGTGVTATVKKAGEETIRAAWVIGCDGSRSTVRKQLELGFDGATDDEQFLLADVKIAWDVRDDRISTWLAEDGLVACFPMREGRWRVIASAPRGDGSEAEPTLADIQGILDRRTATGGQLSDATWLSRFRIHCRQVSTYRDDRVFLAGDAAHVHSPAGGQGMNAGIQDAHNLAWKLAMVHRGEARGIVLDSYTTERHAIGKAILRGTDFATKIGTFKNPVARAARNEAARYLSGFEIVQQRIKNEVSELATTYESSPIVKEDVLSLLSARLGSAAGGETPTIASMREFEAGPKAGARAPDGRVTIAGSGGTKRLANVLDGRGHTLLLFDGRSDSEDGYERLASIERAVRERWGEVIRTYLVTPRSQRPAILPESIPVLLDPDGDLEKRYGASTECLYLIRPDLYVGYRSQPADLDKLVAYLKTILR